MTIYIVAVIVALVLVVILFFALRSTVKRIDYNTKKYFIDKLQDYDYLIEEKQKALNNLNIQIEKSKELLNSLSKKEETRPKGNNIKLNNLKNDNKYIDDDLFKKYKNIKDNFKYDYEDIIKKFISSKSFDDKKYNSLMKIRKRFSNELIYKIVSLKKEEQRKYIENFFDESQISIINQIIGNKNFNINNFLSDLDALIEKNDPIVYISTGNKNINYDYISNHIRTIYDENINEGIKINYKGSLYDYSL